MVVRTLNFAASPCYLPRIRLILLWLFSSFFSLNTLFGQPLKCIDPKERKKKKKSSKISQGRNAVFLTACHVACLMVPSHGGRVNLLTFSLSGPPLLQCVIILNVIKKHLWCLSSWNCQRQTGLNKVTVCAARVSPPCSIIIRKLVAIATSIEA